MSEGIETVEARGHCRVGGEEIAGSRRRQCHFKGLAVLFHEVPGPLQNGEGRVPFIQVTDLRLQPERAEYSPSADPPAAFPA